RRRCARRPTICRWSSSSRCPRRRRSSDPAGGASTPSIQFVTIHDRSTNLWPRICLPDPRARDGGRAMSAPLPITKPPPGTLAERFVPIARSAGASGEDATDPDPRAVVRHVLRILDALSAGEVGDGVSRSTISFLTLLRQQEELGDLSYASPEQARGEIVD